MHKPKNNISALLTEISWIASGRNFVRATSESHRRSTTSLITHPAARMPITPHTKMMIFLIEGCPFPAIHNAHIVGHSSKKIPIGL
ncbi:MAG: hypothetical protein A3I77_04920 [Gammaproteobacteria bacterium RIFCSPLOWO2_02_FULL_42_14]|nr:MAG: hypothetical protein A3B71_06220 [Gammaproteobacteria bacterium RIFCSPHIGHO2_02_FULL_42_43]OGT51576.1 MAG: hypothetical protein A3E54_05985 [Gammaproteobacteria bacterium RIFCSPHIGHO2_12_FULL_41_25]OGT62275.1 MAG: hypothetical protein A3I77_04920 [Gammaproteobacteria bacterium RIFCSPLOWO2_02_FULL_42_14]OGT85949.1 MAG: hypothetical protein A3G86_04610 [Gammaproteobacteria bacterium RIFCSPLOWO2_12_FULL_42_18]